MKRNDYVDAANLRHIAHIYQKGCALDNWDYFMCVKEDEKLYYRKELKEEIDHILQAMPSSFALIIRNDFLCPKERDWWKNRYSLAVYQKMKKIAIMTFFHCLYT